MDPERALEGFRDLADGFAADRHDRQRRNTLDAADFAQLAAAGFLLTGVPTRLGGARQCLAFPVRGSTPAERFSRRPYQYPIAAPDAARLSMPPL